MRYKTPQFLLAILLIVWGLFSLSGTIYATWAIGQYVQSRFSHLPHNLHSTEYRIDGRIINNPIDRSPNRVRSTYDYIISPNPYYRQNIRRNNITPYSPRDNQYYSHSNHTTNASNNALSNDLHDFRLSLESYINQCADIDEDNTSSIVFDCLLGESLPVLGERTIEISPLANNLLFVMWIEYYTESISSSEEQQSWLENIHQLLRTIDEDTADYYHINIDDLIIILESILDWF
jgi:hypothetical protein